ncbi:hypothetical protein [Paenibacillus nasutitermitis]|uniref:Phage protein n=1 Tax=Paenibacillus nasutitermitis TaxID=1652958 RepID=A0A917E2Y4_9BACL|nr:hypothetical protein [Paenibacillus nasutitermitis]GGD95153.1 phage protein [Paenibacillus nasutitermitis]
MPTIADTLKYFKKAGDVAKPYAKFSNIEGMVNTAIGGAMEQTKVMVTFQAQLGNEGQDLFQHIKKDARAAGQDINESLMAGLSLFNGNVEQTEKLTQIATRLSVFDPSGGGMTNSSSMVKDVMGGDTGALTEKYQVSDEVIQASGIVDSAATGNMDAFIASFEKLLELQDMGKSGLEEMLATPAKQVEALGVNLESSLANAGMGAIIALLPAITMLNEAFKDGRFDSFFTSLYMGFEFFGNIASIIIGFVIENLDLFKNMLLVLGAVFAVIAASMLVDLIIMLWPLLAIVAGIGLLITVLNYLGVSTDQVVGFVVGLFYSLWAIVQNRVASMWNLFVSFAEFLKNLFIHPAYAFKKIFYDMLIGILEQSASIAKTIEDMFTGLVNGFIRAWNLISGLFGGKNIEIISGGFSNAVSDTISYVKEQFERDKPVSDKGVYDYSDKKMQYKDAKDSFNSGYDAAVSGFNNAGDMIGNFNPFGESGGMGGAVSPVQPLDDPNKGLGGLPGMDTLTPQMPVTPGMPVSPAFPAAGGDLPDIGKVEEVGKVNDTVDIKGEDLKMMRELAEMKNIQNFVSLTPSVNMTHTGNINNGYDVDAIVGRIKTSLETEIASSAQGVYG